MNDAERVGEIRRRLSVGCHIFGHRWNEAHTEYYGAVETVTYRCWWCKKEEAFTHFPLFTVALSAPQTQREEET